MCTAYVPVALCNVPIDGMPRHYRPSPSAGGACSAWDRITRRIRKWNQSSQSITGGLAVSPYTHDPIQPAATHTKRLRPQFSIDES